LVPSIRSRSALVGHCPAGSNFVSSGIGAVTLTSGKSRCLLGSTILLLLGRLGREI